MKKYYLSKLIGKGIRFTDPFRASVEDDLNKKTESEGENITAKGYQVVGLPPNTADGKYDTDIVMVLVDTEDFSLIDANPDNVFIANFDEKSNPIETSKKQPIQDKLDSYQLDVDVSNLTTEALVEQIKTKIEEK